MTIKTDATDPDVEPERIAPTVFTTLAKQHPTLNEPVITGLLRRGETCNIIAPPKTGKSFLASNLAWCVATGRPWLGYYTEQGRVLIIDNELHPSVLASRYTHVADAMQIEFSERDNIDVLPLRGKITSLENLEFLTDIQPGQYNLIVLDALYRMIPQGTSENDNSGMMALYNQIDSYAATWGAAVVVVHHSSKGSQGDKAVTDVGAGAGAISRAADTHIAIRQHENDGHFVLEAVTRSWKSPEPVSVQFEWPIWTATTLTPEVRNPNRRKSDDQDKQDAEDREYLLLLIPPKGKVQNCIVSESGFGTNKCLRLLGQLKRDGKVDCKKKRRTGSKQRFVVWTPLSDSLSDSFPIRS